MIALQWLALPAIGVMYGLAWDQMPARVATHFGLNQQPNGWMSREGSLTFSLALAALFAVIGSLVLSRIKQPDPASWALLAFFYVIQWTLLYANYSIIGFNVQGRPVNATPLVVVVGLAAVALVVLALRSHRGVEFSRQPVLADETHASPALALLMAVPGIVFVALASQVPVAAARLALSLAVVGMIFAAAMAWSGFHYRFSSAGVEVRTLGLRLRSIPAGEIRSYRVDRWSALGGYGVRGLGNRRAYVCGNRGVKIETADGEVFLGHSQPEKIIRDLDLVIRGTTS